MDQHSVHIHCAGAAILCDLGWLGLLAADLFSSRSEGTTRPTDALKELFLGGEKLWADVGSANRGLPGSLVVSAPKIPLPRLARYLALSTPEEVFMKTSRNHLQGGKMSEAQGDRQGIESRCR